MVVPDNLKSSSSNIQHLCLVIEPDIYLPYNNTAVNHRIFEFLNWKQYLIHTSDRLENVASKMCWELPKIKQKSSKSPETSGLPIQGSLYCVWKESNGWRNSSDDLIIQAILSAQPL